MQSYYFAQQRQYIPIIANSPLFISLYTSLYTSIAYARSSRPVKLLRCTNSKLFDILCQSLQINFILFVRLRLGPNGPEHSYCRGEIIQTPSRVQCRFDHWHRGNQIVTETIVETALQFEEVRGAGEMSGPAGNEIVDAGVLLGIRNTGVT